MSINYHKLRHRNQMYTFNTGLRLHGQSIATNFEFKLKSLTSNVSFKTLLQNKKLETAEIFKFKKIISDKWTNEPMNEWSDMVNSWAAKNWKLLSVRGSEFQESNFLFLQKPKHFYYWNATGRFSQKFCGASDFSSKLRTLITILQ